MIPGMIDHERDPALEDELYEMIADELGWTDEDEPCGRDGGSDVRLTINIDVPAAPASEAEVWAEAAVCGVENTAEENGQEVDVTVADDGSYHFTVS